MCIAHIGFVFNLSGLLVSCQPEIQGLNSHSFEIFYFLSNRFFDTLYMEWLPFAFEHLSICVFPFLCIYCDDFRIDAVQYNLSKSHPDMLIKTQQQNPTS